VHNIARWLAVRTVPRALKDPDLRAVQNLIDEHLRFDCNVIPIDPHTWAIHGSIPVAGDVILAEFSNEEDAEVALELLSAAEQRSSSEEPPRRTHARNPPTRPTCAQGSD
jgi:hypothetical protein